MRADSGQGHNCLHARLIDGSTGIFLLEKFDMIVNEKTTTKHDGLHMWCSQT